MTIEDRFGRNLSAWLHEDGEHRVPDHLGEVLVQTVATRQRPWWSSPERWLPVDTTFRARLVTVPSAGRLLVVAALVLGLLVVAILAAGSQPRLPAPFGLARNGVIATSRDGDIFLLDTTRTESTLIVGGDAFDFSPVFSRDGTRMVFLRSDGPLTEPAFLTMMVVDADGSGLRAVTPRVRSLDWWDWSPNGQQVAYMAAGALWVVDIDGGEPRKLDGTGSAHFPTWLPPDGTEIVYRLESSSPGIFAIQADGTGKPRPLSTTPALNRYDYQGLTVSPDGSVISFTRYSRTGEPSGYLLDLRTGEERRLPGPSDTRAETGGTFSPDGTNVAFVRYFTDRTWQIIVAPVDGSSNGTAIGPRSAGTPQSESAGVNSAAFTPDGAALIVRYGNDEAATSHILPLDGSPGSILNEGSFEFVDMQRLAP